MGLSLPIPRKSSERKQNQSNLTKTPKSMWLDVSRAEQLLALARIFFSQNPLGLGLPWQLPAWARMRRHSQCLPRWTPINDNNLDTVHFRSHKGSSLCPSTHPAFHPAILPSTSPVTFAEYLSRGH